MLRVASHQLRIADPTSSLAFYTQALGMHLVGEQRHGDCRHYLLSFAPPGSASPQAVLELIHHADQAFDVRVQPDSSEGYWKIAIAVPHLDIARGQLLARGIEVGAAFQVPDVAYLCHLTDPDGYCIELIQHTFEERTPTMTVDTRYALGVPATFSLSTFRVKDPRRSLAFYRDILGMRLLSRQVVASREMTLYFLADSDETLPVEDIDAVANREWLWQRPYTLIELQHIWGTEEDEAFRYRVGSETGFEGLTLMMDCLQTPTPAALCCGEEHQVQMRDHDGYRLKLSVGG